MAQDQGRFRGFYHESNGVQPLSPQMKRDLPSHIRDAMARGGQHGGATQSGGRHRDEQQAQPARHPEFAGA